MRDLMKTVAVHSRVTGLLAAFSASVLLTSCATGQIDLTAEAPTVGTATITGDRKFVYLVFYIYLHECGITHADSTSVDKLIGAKTVTVPEGVHRLSVTCKVDSMSEHRFYEGELSFFAQAGHEYKVSFNDTCIVAIDNANEAVVKSDCEPGIGP